MEKKLTETDQKLQDFVLSEIFCDLEMKCEHISFSNEVDCSLFFAGCPVDTYAKFAANTVKIINEHSLIGLDSLDYETWVMVCNVIYEALYAGLADEESTCALYVYALKDDKNSKDLIDWFLKNDEWIETIIGDFDLLEDSQWLHWLDIAESISWPIMPTGIPIRAHLFSMDRHVPKWDEENYTQAQKFYKKLKHHNPNNVDGKKIQTKKTVEHKEPGNVYLMVNNMNGRIKIGKTSDATPVYRERTLQSQEPDVSLLFYKQVLYMSKTERFLHSVFKDSRFRGEWFDLNEEHIKQAKAMIKKAVCEPIH